MWWVLLFLGIGLAGLAVLTALTVSLWRRFRGLLDELARTGERAGEVLELLGQIRAEPTATPGDVTTVDGSGPAVQT